MAEKCKFANEEVSVRQTEQLIIGTRHATVQEKLLEMGSNLDGLEKALDGVRTQESTKSQLAQMQGTKPVGDTTTRFNGQVHAISSKPARTTLNKI